MGARSSRCLDKLVMTELRRATLPDHAVVEVGHGEDEVEIVPLKHAVGNGELLEPARLQVAADGWMRGGPQEWPEIHFGDFAVAEFDAQTMRADVANVADLDGFISDGSHGNTRLLQTEPLLHDGFDLYNLVGSQRSTMAYEHRSRNAT